MIYTVDAGAKEFEKIVSGEKTFGILSKRKDVNIGDLIGINEHDPDNGCYTGRCCLAYIDYIEADDNGLNDGYWAIGFKPCIVYKASEPFSHAKLTHDYSLQVITRDNPGNSNYL